MRTSTLLQRRNPSKVCTTPRLLRLEQRRTRCRGVHPFSEPRRQSARRIRGEQSPRHTDSDDPLSIARLELLGAVTAVKLAIQIKKALGSEIALEIFYWTDSMVVLFWINGEWVLWKEWVSNRCRFIQENTPRSEWRHIPGVLNPADICSRGMMPSKLVDTECIWFTGPKFLQLSPNQWPTSPLTVNVLDRSDVSSEMKRVSAVLVSTSRSTLPTIFNVERYSTLETVLRYTAHIQRGLFNTAAERFGRVAQKGELTAVEFHQANLYWFRHLQAAAFPVEREALEHNESVNRSSIIGIFHSYIKKDGLIHINARTKLSSDLISTPDVPILPSKLPGEKGTPHFIVILIRQAHRRVFHAGITSTLSELRRHCWITRGRQTVIKVLKACVVCNRYQRKGYNQPMAPLPALRCTFNVAFAVAGLDLMQYK